MVAGLELLPTIAKEISSLSDFSDQNIAFICPKGSLFNEDPLSIYLKDSQIEGLEIYGSDEQRGTMAFVFAEAVRKSGFADEIKIRIDEAAKKLNPYGYMKRGFVLPFIHQFDV